jgi:uroporphyrinogen-III synthase
MSSKLNGARVALLEGRMSSELANLVKHYGGEPVTAPALKEEQIDSSQEILSFIEKLEKGEISVLIFLTGVGVSTLLKEAENLGVLDRLLTVLNSSKVTNVCRGPKPSSVLRRNNINISVSVPEPYTTHDIITSISALELEGKGVGILHYGERNLPLTEEIKNRGANLIELCLYEWRLPDDLEPIKNLIKDIIYGSIDATAFTSQIQVRHLFQVASDIGLADDLTNAMRTKTVVVAVGPTCALALENFGTPPQVVPEHPKMGPMLLALGEYLEKHKAL